MVPKAEMVGYALLPPGAQKVTYAQMVALRQGPCYPRRGFRNNSLRGRASTEPVIHESARIRTVIRKIKALGP
jgi:hypothetical protein